MAEAERQKEEVEEKIADVEREILTLLQREKSGRIFAIDLFWPDKTLMEHFYEHYLYYSWKTMALELKILCEIIFKLRRSIIRHGSLYLRFLSSNVPILIFIKMQTITATIDHEFEGYCGIITLVWMFTLVHTMHFNLSRIHNSTGAGQFLFTRKGKWVSSDNFPCWFMAFLHHILNALL